jgi:hypothetical protein
LSVISRVRKTFIAGAIFLGLELLGLGFFNSRSFAWRNPHLAARLTLITSADATPVVLQSRAQGDDGSVAANDDDTTCARFFAAAGGRAQMLLRRVAVPLCFSQIPTRKISRYIFKSVLIL